MEKQKNSIKKIRFICLRNHHQLEILYFRGKATALPRPENLLNKEGGYLAGHQQQVYTFLLLVPPASLGPDTELGFHYPLS